ncbi:MAG: TonB-dependent receptor, partial [Verrucomicrobiales bacterium]|nr:TonB-dependent receptor [Verrucomicrobiales bacterium]
VIRCGVTLFCSVVLLASGFDVARAQSNSVDVSASQLKAFSLEQLMGMDVTSVSRRPEPLADAPASIQVITHDDIHRSGATTIPEALRLADNLQVAQVDSREWAISARGFNGSIANKLLVMIDGRTVYTPLFSGVFWDVQNYLLDDIDRIEVVSGPGGTLWGPNAVNGVINIITRRAQDTQGLLLEGAGGTELRDLAGIRYGGKLSSNVFYRVYGEFFNRDGTVNSKGADREDEWLFGQGGFRLDWDQSIQNTVTVSGDFYDARFHQLNLPDASAAGGNLLSRWTHLISEDSSTQVQFYYDRTHRISPTLFAEDLDTYDLDFQHRFALGERHNFVWGAAYRFTHDRVQNSPMLRFLPPDMDRNLVSFFVQDEITLLTNLVFMAGTKVDHNDYTGWEVQPSGRLSWHPAPEHLLWGAVSRAVREPSRIDQQAFVFTTNVPPTEILAGGPGFQSEAVIAYELGYRAQLFAKSSVSLSTFYNQYTRLRSISATVPAFVQNNVQGDTRGLELTLSQQITESWRMHAGYTFLDEDIHVAAGQTDLNQGRAETADPRHQFSISSSINLPANLDLDARLRFVDRLNVGFGSTPSYGELDVRLAWHASQRLEVSLVGQNLLHDHHPEFGPAAPTRAEIERSCFAKLTYRY